MSNVHFQEDRPEVTLPPQKRLSIALGPGYEVGESSSAAFGGYMREFETRVRQDTEEIYMRLDDEQNERQLLEIYRYYRVEDSSTRTDDNSTGIGDSFVGTGYRITGTAGTRWSLLSITGSIPASKALDYDVIFNLVKLAPKRTTRLPPATTTTTTTTPETNTQLKALIDQGVADALVARDADRSQNGEDSHDSGMGVRRQAPPARECTYPDFMKCKPLYFKCNEGVTVGYDVAYAMTWTNLKRKMTDKYCPRGKIKKLEELALMCARMFPEESDKIERYVGGLPDMIHKSVMASEPKIMQDAIEFTTELINKKIHTFSERRDKSKRKFEDTSKNNQNQQQNKRQNTGMAYTTGSGEKKPYGGVLEMPILLTTKGASQKPTCFECGAQGHFKRECLKLKNNNRGNPARNGNAPAKVYAVGHARKNPDSNIVTGTFLLNNHYAFILFDTCVDRSFVSTAFSYQIDITLTTLDHFYDVELADGRIIRLNTIIRGFTLNFLNYPFNIDLMPVELGSFDVIIGMDWLAKYHVVIVYAKKIVRIP
nr:hypothetical protein [Tanacetum cinerariifolium]